MLNLRVELGRKNSPFNGRESLPTAVAVTEVVPTKTVHCYPNEKSVLCYHLEAKDYVHEGLVEEKVDVEKTQKSEQKVEKGFSTMFPALWS